MNLIAISVIPVVLIFLVSIASQQIALQYTNQYVNEYGENIFKNQIYFSSSTQSFISFRLSREIYKIPFHITWLNLLHEKLIQGKLVLDNRNRPSIVHAMMIYYSKLSPELNNLIQRNKYYINSWFQQNATQIDQLDITGQQILYNISRLTPFFNTVGYQSRQKQSNILTISYQSVNIFTTNKGFFLTHYVNNSLSSKLDSDNCYKGLFVYDPRCRYFYISSVNQTSIFMNPPKFSVASTPPYLSQYTCQMYRKLNESTLKIENSHIQCIEATLSNIYNYFQNVIKSSKQYYVIDPRSLLIYFNSKKEYNYTNITSADNFYKTELQYLQDQDEANKIMKYIQDNYNKWVFSEEKDSQVNLVQMFDLSKQVTIMDYKRNGTTYKVIFNPVIQYDQIPTFVTKLTNRQGLLLEYAYLQINIISDEDLKEQKNKLLRFFSKFFFYVQITIGVVSISFIIITVYYAILIKRLITNPILRMKETLEEINQLKEFVDISEIIKEYEQKSEEIFLSKETYMLYQSFLDLFEMIQYTSESFFIENEGQTLISLSKKVEFFTKFRNYSAAGVTHNNIGNILLNQQHFFQALEHFSLAIMYAKYELSAYFKKNPDSQFSHLLSSYSYIEYQEELQDQSQRLNSISQKVDIKKPSISKQRQFSQEKRISNDIQELTTSMQIQKNTQTPLNPGNILTTKTHFSKSKKDKQSFENLNLLNQIKIQKSINVLKQNKQMSSISNRQRHESQQLKQSEEKHQILELILNLFYRQQNYITSLTAFQENINSMQEKQKLQNSYNFWKEIKSLIFNQLKLLNYLPEIQHLKVFLICMISKCYYNQFKNNKAKQKFKEAESILMNLEKINESKEKDISNQPESINAQKDSVQDQKQKTQSKQLNDSSESPKKVIFQSPKGKQQHKMDTSEIMNNCSQENMRLQKIQNQESFINSIESSQKILLKSRTFFQNNLKNYMNKNSSPMNENEQKSYLYKSQIMDKIIQSQQNKLIEISQANNLSKQTLTLETINQYFKFTLSEYYLFIKKYKKSAEILTQLYENSQNFSSNLPFCIIYRIKQIFDAHQIQDLCLYEEYARFNKNLSLQIIISFEVTSYQDDKNSNFSKQKHALIKNQINNDIFKSCLSDGQIKLLNEISTNVLTRDFDKICFYSIDQQEKSIKKVMNLIESKLFRLYKNSIFEKLDISNLDYSPCILSKSFVSKDVNELEIIEDSKVFEEYFNNNDEYQINANQKRFLISDLKVQSQLYIQQKNQSLINQDKINQTQNNLNQDSPSNKQSLNIKNSTKAYEIKNKNTNLLQQFINLNKEIIEYSIKLQSQNEQIESVYFYDYICQAIDQLISDQFTYKISENQVQIKKNANQENNFDIYKQIISQELDGLEQQKALKFMIYQTNKILIIQDSLFMNLCSFLASINFQVIIFLTEKGNSFLEQSLNGAYIFQNKEVIKIFYKLEEIISI